MCIFSLNGYTGHTFSVVSRWNPFVNSRPVATPDRPDSLLRGRGKRRREEGQEKLCKNPKRKRQLTRRSIRSSERSGRFQDGFHRRWRSPRGASFCWSLVSGQPPHLINNEAYDRSAVPPWDHLLLAGLFVKDRSDTDNSPSRWSCWEEKEEERTRHADVSLSD